MKTTIRVTSRHIEFGEKHNAWRCALALAFYDAGFLVAVAEDRVSFYPAGNRLAVSRLLPITAKKFVAEFGADLPVNPFQFKMDHPPAAFDVSRKPPSSLVHA